MSKSIHIGKWPDLCVQSAFVQGAKWMTMRLQERSMLASERAEVERAAVRVYGEPVPGAKQPVTEKQIAVLRFIRDHKSRTGAQPTVREIAVHFSIKSPNGVAAHIKSMVRKGLISKSGRGVIAFTNYGSAAIERGDS